MAFSCRTKKKLIIKISLIMLCTALFPNVKVYANCDEININDKTMEDRTVRDMDEIYVDDNEKEQEAFKIVERIIKEKDKAIIERNAEYLDKIYNKSIRTGKWAYEGELARIKCIDSWEKKQGAKFIEINPKLIVRKIKISEKRMNVKLSCTREYKYIYEENLKDEENNLKKEEENLKSGEHELKSGEETLKKEINSQDEKTNLKNGEGNLKSGEQNLQNQQIPNEEGCDSKEVNVCRTGGYYVVELINKDGEWLINKEWCEDPFYVPMNLEKTKIDNMREFILSQNKKDFSDLNNKRKKAVEYANQYCGTATEEKYGYNYNKKYKNYNSEGGDCANFASQILFEGGKFRKNSTWSYSKDGGTRAWVNADGFKDYMINSGRASVISHGTYDKVYKSSFKLLPGDFVAYEEKGDIIHISVVTAQDSKGYPLVTCHNTDRNNVPWDIGWGGKNIKFWLVRVHF